MKAAVYGTVAGILFGLSAALPKPTLEFLHAGIDEPLSHWEPALASPVCSASSSSRSRSVRAGWPRQSRRSRWRTRGRDPPGAHPVDERLSRPAWHIVVATAGLFLALAGAVVISLARESGGEADPSARPMPGTAAA